MTRQTSLTLGYNSAGPQQSRMGAHDMTTTRRYSITAVAAMMADLEAWIEQSSDTLNNEEAKDYPNEDRLDNLNTRIDALQAAYDALADIEPV